MALWRGSPNPFAFAVHRGQDHALVPRRLGTGEVGIQDAFRRFEPPLTEVSRASFTRNLVRSRASPSHRVHSSSGSSARRWVRRVPPRAIAPPASARLSADVAHDTNDASLRRLQPALGTSTRGPFDSRARARLAPLHVTAAEARLPRHRGPPPCGEVPPSPRAIDVARESFGISPSRGPSRACSRWRGPPPWRRPIDRGVFDRASTRRGSL